MTADSPVGLETPGDAAPDAAMPENAASEITSAEFRRMPVADMIEWIGRNGEPTDPRDDIDADSLVRRFPHLGAVATIDVTLDGPNGPLPGRIYVDETAQAVGVGFVWAHGGAFLGGHLDIPEANWTSLELASRGVPVLSIDYTKCVRGVHYPVPSDDVLAWWEEARSHSLEWLGVPGDRLVLGGASAGATLTAGAVQRLIDAERPVPAGLILVYPALHPDPTDPTAVAPKAAHLDGLTMNFAGSLAALTDPQVFPGWGNGRGFPRTFVVACERDAFVPSAEAFVRTLERAGVAAQYRLELDSHHGHIDEPSDAGAHRTLAAMREWLGA
ncbi:acetyl esterase/lipase [Pseudoclavibacter sp. JAI123]|uniref:alpha/beta hydrolase n=1 Tax=Pseudoclavibacter sp. JAI123 TaxID=2723065 RepID=UPI0017A235DF|nr:alpha/beta hydrolase fold domain-containing protein [Pseudoclavibacter sp. JAI123]NYF14898.1 acetyl esterase/lipase [Pseudoclavibacter sp. JAI123]